MQPCTAALAFVLASRLQRSFGQCLSETDPCGSGHSRRRVLGCGARLRWNCEQYGGGHGRRRGGFGWRVDWRDPFTSLSLCPLSGTQAVATVAWSGRGLPSASGLHGVTLHVLQHAQGSWRSLHQQHWDSGVRWREETVRVTVPLQAEGQNVLRATLITREEVNDPALGNCARLVTPPYSTSIWTRVPDPDTDDQSWWSKEVVFHPARRSAACSAGLCSTGWRLAEERSEGFCVAASSCSRELCCEALGTCDAFSCGAGWQRRGAAPAYCAGTECSHGECCEALGTCSGFSCGAGWQRRGAAPAYCAGAACSQGECCEALGTCSGFSCGAGWQRRSVAPAYCAGTGCSRGECCEALGACSAFSCGAGWQRRSAAPAHCAGRVCSQGECCEALGTCSAFLCGAGWQRRGAAPAYCTGMACLQAECCEAFGTCSAFGCGAGWQSRSQPPDRCAGVVCSQPECCSELPSCTAFTCGPGWRRRKATEGHCAAALCTEGECCERLGSCSDFTCSGVWEVAAPRQLHCEAPQCTAPECCRPVTTTTRPRCSPPYHVDQPRAAQGPIVIGSHIQVGWTAAPCTSDFAVVTVCAYRRNGQEECLGAGLLVLASAQGAQVLVPHGAYGFARVRVSDDADPTLYGHSGWFSVEAAPVVTSSTGTLTSTRVTSTSTVRTAASMKASMSTAMSSTISFTGTAVTVSGTSETATGTDASTESPSTGATSSTTDTAERLTDTSSQIGLTGAASTDVSTETSSSASTAIIASGTDERGTVIGMDTSVESSSTGTTSSTTDTALTDTSSKIGLTGTASSDAPTETSSTFSSAGTAAVESGDTKAETITSTHVLLEGYSGNSSTTVTESISSVQTSSPFFPATSSTIANSDTTVIVPTGTATAPDATTTTETTVGATTFHTGLTATSTMEAAIKESTRTATASLDTNDSGKQAVAMETTMGATIVHTSALVLTATSTAEAMKESTRTATTSRDANDSGQKAVVMTYVSKVSMVLSDTSGLAEHAEDPAVRRVFVLALAAVLGIDEAAITILSISVPGKGSGRRLAETLVLVYKLEVKEGVAKLSAETFSSPQVQSALLAQINDGLRDSPAPAIVLDLTMLAQAIQPTSSIIAPASLGSRSATMNLFIFLLLPLSFDPALCRLSGSSKCGRRQDGPEARCACEDALSCPVREREGGSDIA